jgi:probable F420-dependent oxidoreductase
MTEAASPAPDSIAANRGRPVGLAIPNMGEDAPAAVRELPALAEDLGYDSVWVTDHLVGVRATDEVYGPYWMEAVTALTWIAATTRTIRVGTGVLVVPHRDPLLTAKMLTSLDVLSDGRLDVGIGTGWSKTEYRALGVGDRFEPRGAVTNEALEVMLACWAGGEIEHAGTYFAIKHVRVQPLPRQSPHPPIWVGGTSGPALRRAAAFGDVWHPNDISPRELREAGDRLDELAGRPVARSVRLDTSDEQLDRIDELVDEYLTAGAVRVVIEFRGRNLEQTRTRAEKAAKLLFA